MIRILHVIGEMGCGGAETMLMNLYRSIDRNKIQFDFVVHTPERQFYDDEIEALGGRIYRTKRFNVINYLAYRRFWNDFLREHQEYKIIHGHINSSAAIYLSLAKKYGRITVVHSHATRSQEKSIRALVFRCFSFPVRYIADYFFACSQQAAEDRFGKKVSESKRCQILYNAIDVRKFHYDCTIRERLRRENNIPQRRLIVGHVGRFVSVKNHKYLIDIFEQIHKSHPDSQLWLVGEGPLETQIREKIRSKGIENSVIFCGITDHVQDYLQVMDLFIFPSITEGLGIALIEAQATGLPCVVSEAIQGEADIGAGLIFPMCLKDSVESWANVALKAVGHERSDVSSYVISAGYDITDMAKRIQTFYMNLGQE